MHIRVAHLTTYRYAAPAASVVQILRLTPRNHDGQYITHWRIDVSADCRLDQHEDAFGNVTHAFTAEGPFTELKVLVEGEVETRDTQGIVRGAVERFPPSLFLRETPLTAADEPIQAFAEAARLESGSDGLSLLHHLLARLTDEMTLADDGPVGGGNSASQAFAAKRGTTTDFAHVFLAAARSLAIPARYVGGYIRGDNGGSTDATRRGRHGWAEAEVGGLGWIAFDPTQGLYATDAYVRVAVGLDHLGAAPARVATYGGGGETLAVELAVEQAGHQNQS